jgi:hypothetical protein
MSGGRDLVEREATEERIRGGSRKLFVLLMNALLQVNGHETWRQEWARKVDIIEGTAGDFRVIQLVSQFAWFERERSNLKSKLGDNRTAAPRLTIVENARRSTKKLEHTLLSVRVRVCATANAKLHFDYSDIIDETCRQNCFN